MPDELTWEISLLGGALVVVSLFFSPYLRGDPMVRPLPSITLSLNGVYTFPSLILYQP